MYKETHQTSSLTMYARKMLAYMHYSLHKYNYVYEHVSKSNSYNMGTTLDVQYPQCFAYHESGFEPGLESKCVIHLGIKMAKAMNRFSQL